MQINSDFLSVAIDAAAAAINPFNPLIGKIINFIENYFRKGFVVYVYDESNSERAASVSFFRSQSYDVYSVKLRQKEEQTEEAFVEQTAQTIDTLWKNLAADPKYQDKQQLLYGHSLGVKGVLKSITMDHVKPSRLILEGSDAKFMQNMQLQNITFPANFLISKESITRQWVREILIQEMNKVKG